MPRAHFIKLVANARTNLASTLIAGGLAILFAASMAAGLPVATAIALIALGASRAIRDGIQCLGWPREFLAAHLVTYTGLYVLVVVAICNVAYGPPDAGLSAAQGIDLGLSAVVMAYATRFCVAALLRRSDSRAS
jgi:hypothetical protein